MTTDVKARLQRYCIAIFSTIAATWLRSLMDEWLGDRVPFGTYLLAVLFTAWLAGTGPATLSLLLGILAAAHYHVRPANSIVVEEPADLLALFVYGVVGAVAISLFDRSARQHDVTRRQLAQIEALSGELTTADHRKDEFLALLAHELRNPLAPIRSGLMLLQRPDVEVTHRTAVLRTVCRQLDQLVRIVDELLDVARVVHGRISLTLARVDLRELVETAIEQVQPSLQEHRHTLRVLLPESPVMLDGDRVRLIQTVANLLANAAKYTPDGGRIQVLLDADSREASLKVIDNGIGITRDVQGRIFELFARSDAAMYQDRAGLGLGLPLARQLAELHAGRLIVSSDGPGRGSCFTLTLPVVGGLTSSRDEQLKTVGPAANGEAGRPRDPVDAPSSMRVLIVDDNCDAATMLAALLSFEGFEVRTAQDGTDGIRQAECYDPEVILLDIGLPGMDGYEVARRLRSSPTLHRPRIIAVTGWGGAADVKRSQLAGIDHHLVKPVDPDEVTRLIRGESASTACAVP